MGEPRTALPLGLPRYTPRPATNVLKRIIDEHLEDLKLVHDERFARTHGPLSPRVIDLFVRFLKCDLGPAILDGPSEEEESPPSRRGLWGQ